MPGGAAFGAVARIAGRLSGVLGGGGLADSVREAAEEQLHWDDAPKVPDLPPPEFTELAPMSEPEILPMPGQVDVEAIREDFNMDANEERIAELRGQINDLYDAQPPPEEAPTFRDRWAASLIRQGEDIGFFSSEGEEGRSIRSLIAAARRSGDETRVYEAGDHDNRTGRLAPWRSSQVQTAYVHTDAVAQRVQALVRQDRPVTREQVAALERLMIRGEVGAARYGRQQIRDVLDFVQAGGPLMPIVDARESLGAAPALNDDATRVGQTFSWPPTGTHPDGTTDYFTITEVRSDGRLLVEGNGELPRDFAEPLARSDLPEGTNSYYVSLADVVHNGEHRALKERAIRVVPQVFQDDLSEARAERARRVRGNVRSQPEQRAAAEPTAQTGDVVNLSNRTAAGGGTTAA